MMSLLFGLSIQVKDLGPDSPLVEIVWKVKSILQRNLYIKGLSIDI